MAYIRKTYDVWEVHQHTGDQNWEVVNTETTRKDGLRSVREYRQNGHSADGVGYCILHKRRVKIGEQP